MRNIVWILLLLVLSEVGVAQAAWTDDFMQAYDDFGMGIAVENALDNEVTPHEILTYLISNNEEFNMRKGLKALYCAGVDRDTVREAADKLGITVEELSAALEESIAECGDKLTLSDRDLFDGRSGSKLGLSDRDIAPPPEEVLTPPVQPSVQPPVRSAPSAPPRETAFPEEQTAPFVPPQEPPLSEQISPPPLPPPASPSAP